MILATDFPVAQYCNYNTNRFICRESDYHDKKCVAQVDRQAPDEPEPWEHGHNSCMRLQPADIEMIRQVTHDVLGHDAPIRLFGSRLDDAARGGDVDLFLELDAPPENPAWLAATLAGKISRRMHGRKVDVLISAPGLMNFPVHDVARQHGVIL